MALSKGKLEKMNKIDLIELCVEMQQGNDASVLTQINGNLELLNHRFEKLESELTISKKVGGLLQTKIKALERRCVMAEQYSRRECLEISGIPVSISNDDLEEKVRDIFNLIEAPVSAENIEACHRIGPKEKGRTIIKLSRRKDVFSVLKSKKKFKDDVTEDDLEGIGLSRESKIYINESLCGASRELFYKATVLKRMKKLFRYWTSNGIVKIKLTENGDIHQITHSDDLQYIFPNINIEELGK